MYIYNWWWISFVFAFHPSSTAVSSRSYYSVPLACNRKNNVVFERLDVSYYLLTLPSLISFSFFPFFPPPPPRSCRGTKRNFVSFRGNRKRHEKEVTSLILLCLEGGEAMVVGTAILSSLNFILDFCGFVFFEVIRRYEEINKIELDER